MRRAVYKPEARFTTVSPTSQPFASQLKSHRRIFSFFSYIRPLEHTELPAERISILLSSRFLSRSLSLSCRQCTYIATSNISKRYGRRLCSLSLNGRVLSDQETTKKRISFLALLQFIHGWILSDRAKKKIYKALYRVWSIIGVIFYIPLCRSTTASIIIIRTVSWKYTQSRVGELYRIQENYSAVRHED